MNHSKSRNKPGVLLQLPNCNKGLYLIACCILSLVGSTAQSQIRDTAKQARKSLFRSQLYLKNNFYLGTSFGSSTRNAEDVDLQFFAIENLTRSRSSVRLEGGFFIKNNWALGAIGRYSSGRTEIDFLSAEGIPTAFRSASEQYSLYINSKYFVPLGFDNRFIVFANAMLGGSRRNQVTETLSDGLLQRGFSTVRRLEFVIQPGVSFNIIKGLNVELAMELASIGGEWRQSSVNGEPTSNVDKFRGNFSFNILRTDFGLFYYFNTHAKKTSNEKQ